MNTITARRPRVARVLFGALAALSLAGGLAVAAPAAPAEASTASTCPAGRLCLYFNSNHQGARADLELTDYALNNELFSDGPAYRNGWNVLVGNNAASVWNRTGAVAYLYDGRGCTGAYVRLLPGAKVNLGTLKNRVSSINLFSDSLLCNVNRDQSRF